MSEFSSHPSFATLARHRGAVVAERLIDGAATPERGSPEGVLFKAVSAALGVLSAEAAGMADAVVAEGQRVASDRVAAAETLIRRAEQAGTEAALERERARGRVDELERTVEAERAGRGMAEKALAAAQERESGLRDAVGAFRSEIAERREAHEHDRIMVTTLEGEVGAGHKALARERDGRAADVERLSGELRTETRRAAGLDTALARTEAERDAAATRVDEARARGEVLETDRDAARERADRLDGALGELERRARAVEDALDAARRTENDLRDHAGRLRARLLAADVETDDIGPTPAPRTVEDRVGLPPDDRSGGVEVDPGSGSSSGGLATE